jgi:hypothetical protein
MSRYKYLLLCAFCFLLCTCKFDESSIELASIEYIDSKSFIITIAPSDISLPYKINDNTLSVYSTKYDLYYRIDTAEKLSNVKYKCCLKKDFKKGDKIRVNGHGLFSGTVYLNVSEEE